MIDFPEATAQVVAVRLKGIVTKADVKSAYERINAALRTNKRIGILINFSAFDDATTNAIAEDIKAEFALIKKMKAFARIALVTDKNWLADMLKIASGMVPTMETKVFGSGDFANAIEWVGDFDSEEDPTTNAVKRIPTDRADLLAYDVNGRMTEGDVELLNEDMTAAFDKFGKVDLLVRFTKFNGVEFDALFDDDMWSMKTRAFGHINRYAIVGAPEWLQTIGKGLGSLTPIAMEFFDVEEEAKAWSWLAERTAA